MNSELKNIHTSIHLKPRGKVLDGRTLAKEITHQLSVYVKKNSLRPVLCIVLVGNNPASEIYVRNKLRISEETGLSVQLKKYPSDITQEALLKEIESINADPKIHGILVQSPVPSHLNYEIILNKIDYLKDVDGLTKENQGLLSKGDPLLAPCTAKGVICLLKSYGISLEGKHIVIIGRSLLVGKPLAMLSLLENMTVTIAHRKSKNLEEIVRAGDIVVAAAGVSGLITKNHLKKNAIVIDVGINQKDGKIVGDVLFDQVKDHASFISPVPGGVGPMTIAMLMENTIIACSMQTKDL